ncbi:hypothetical protein PYW08_006093 [Mythimna loreyi]|uniref:Uncharacterized protein n=1 Tax=Mythimna loreyi TaxID=667449 RepID=A0ACC2QLN1_9NEOP|nr:hypothetical protein PYW08_006093 [Mythimna loreyi]
MPWLRDKRIKWINAVVKHTKHPNNWLPSKNTTICSAHFIGNKKSENPLHLSVSMTSKTCPDSNSFWPFDIF